MMTKTRAAVALLLAATALGAQAQTLSVPPAEDETRPYVSGGYSHVFADDTRTSDNGQGFFFGAGKTLNQHWGLEFGLFHHQFDRRTAADNNWREYGGKVDGLFFYSRDRRFQPYVGLGLGGVRTQRKGGPGESTDPFADFGVGFFKYFEVGSGDLGLRADLRYRWVDTDLPGISEFQEPVARIGLVMAMGDKLAAEELPLGPDSDGDGVLDDADLCPDTPKGVKVDAKGCPVGLDSDGDGVLDDQDVCPGTSKGAPVDARGCPVGRDGRGFRVIGEGSERRFEDVHFAFDQSDLTGYAQSMLDSAASLINDLSQEYPKLRIIVDGHTDWIGTDGYNMGLGERRANAVKQYLMRKGVAAERIDTTSYGESKPVASNESEDGRALNRRAEVRTSAQQ